MKKLFSPPQILLVFIFQLYFYSPAVYSQTLTEVNSYEDDTKHVFLAVSDFNQAMVNRDKAILDLLSMEELSYGHSSGKIENKKTFIDEIIYGDFDFISTNTENQTINFSGESTAVVRHILLIEAINKGEKVSIRIGNMMVFKKQDKLWKLLARQAYKL